MNRKEGKKAYFGFTKVFFAIHPLRTCYRMKNRCEIIQNSLCCLDNLVFQNIYPVLAIVQKNL